MAAQAAALIGRERQAQGRGLIAIRSALPAMHQHDGFGSQRLRLRLAHRPCLRTNNQAQCACGAGPGPDWPDGGRPDPTQLRIPAGLAG